MILETRVRASNSIIYFHGQLSSDDDTSEEIECPEVTDEGALWANEQCVIVGTFPEMDGETLIRVSTQPVSDGSDGLKLAYDGELSTFGGVFLVTDVPGEVQLAMRVDSETCRCSIYTSDEVAPDVIYVQLEGRTSVRS